jgi:hypothetical protein
MVKHIVIWTLKDEAEGRAKAQLAAEAKKRLESMYGRIPGLLKLEAGINSGPDKGAADLLLYCEFPDFDALKAYQEHPVHREFVEYIRKSRDTRQVVDYEVKS